MIRIASVPAGIVGADPWVSYLVSKEASRSAPLLIIDRFVFKVKTIIASRGFIGVIGHRIGVEHLP